MAEWPNSFWRSALSVRGSGCQNYRRRLNPVWHKMLYSCTHMATVGVKGLKNSMHATRHDQKVPASLELYGRDSDASQGITVTRKIRKKVLVHDQLAAPRRASMSTTDKPQNILNTSIRSTRILRSSSVHNFNLFNLISFRTSFKPGIIRVKRLWTFSSNFLFFL